MLRLKHFCTDIQVPRKRDKGVMTSQSCISFENKVYLCNFQLAIFVFGFGKFQIGSNIVKIVKNFIIIQDTISSVQKS